MLKLAGPEAQQIEIVNIRDILFYRLIIGQIREYQCGVSQAES